jgi:hypothetical protein
MQFHFLCRTAKTAGPHLIPIKSYSKNTHPSSFLKGIIARVRTFRSFGCILSEISFLCTQKVSTGWPINNCAIRNLNISTLFQSNGLIIFVGDRGEFKVFFDKNNVYKYSFELSSLTRIQKFDFYRNGVNGIWKRFFIRFLFPTYPFDRENCSLSICARPRSLACSVQKLYVFSREPPKSTKWPLITLKCVTIGVIGHAESSDDVYF